MANSWFNLIALVPLAIPCALFGDGTAQCWGRNDDGQLGDGTFTSSSTPLRVGGLTGAAAVSGGLLHTCALPGDGTAQCWGPNAGGQLGHGATKRSRDPRRGARLPSGPAVRGGPPPTPAPPS